MRGRGQHRVNNRFEMIAVGGRRTGPRAMIFTVMIQVADRPRFDRLLPVTRRADTRNRPSAT